MNSVKHTAAAALALFQSNMNLYLLGLSRTECLQLARIMMDAASSIDDAPPTPGPKRRGNDARRTAMKKQKGKMPPNKPGKKGC